MQDDFVEIDVRSLLEQGRSPLPLIMNTVASLEPGQGLRLLTAWEPFPLYQVMADQGFSHESKAVEEDFWIIDFQRTGEPGGASDFHPPCIL